MTTKNPITEQQIQLFHQAIDLEPDKRVSFLQTVCDDPELRQSVLEMLHQSVKADLFFQTLSEDILHKQTHELEEFNARSQQIGNYRIEHLIAQGGMGSVFLAKRADGQFERTVVIKMLPMDFDSEELAERLIAEQNVLAGLVHPNIAQLYDAGIDQEQRGYFVMEYIDGKKITDYANQQQLNQQQRIDLFLDLLGAIQYAHQNLIVHSDIKPSNIMVTNDGVVKLLDFGIAKPIRSDGQQQVSGGEYSRLYAAPEQLTNGKITTATDTYQAGRLLFELLTGPSDQPLNANNDALKSLPEDLSAILLKSISPNSDSRYQTANELALDLKKMRQQIPVSARPSTLGYRTGRFLARNRFAVFSLSLIVLLSLIFASAMAWQARRLVIERDKALQVSDFLVNVFELASPQQSPGSDPTATQILEHGLDRINHHFNGQQSTKADLLIVIGRTFQNLGQYDKAESVFDNAKQILIANRLDKQQAMARLLTFQGENQQLLGNFDQSSAHLGQALKLFKRKPAAHQLEIASTSAKLGRVLGRQSNFEQARTYLKNAAEIYRAELGENHLEYADILNDIGSVDFSAGNYQETQQNLSHALKIRDQLALDDQNILINPDYATNVNNLGLAHFRQGQLNPAENLFRRAVELRDQIYLEPHPEQAQSLTNLGLLLDADGRPDEASLYLERALEVRLDTLGAKHMRVAEAQNNLGMLHLSNARFDQSLTLYQQALPIIVDQLGEDHPVTATIMSNIGQSYLELNDYPAALQNYQRSLQIRESKLPPGHLFISYSQIGLGRTLSALDEHPKALELITTGLQIRQQKLPPDHWLIGDANLALALAYQAQGDQQNSAQYATIAYDILLASKGENSYLTQRANQLIAAAD